MKFVDEQALVNTYLKGDFSLREISRIYNIDHHRVKRLLLDNNVKIYKKKAKICIPKGDKSKLFGRKYTVAHCKNIGLASKGRKPYNLGKKMSEDCNRKNMVAHLCVNISLSDIEKYKNFEKLKFLTKSISRHRKSFDDKQKFLSFLDKFYFDEYFSLIYRRWLENDKNKWYMPTLEHKTPKSKNGSNSLENLDFLTWFENRAKAEMSLDEWNTFKKITNTKSILFK